MNNNLNQNFYQFYDLDSDSTTYTSMNNYEN